MRVIVAVGYLQPIGITNDDNNLPIHDILTSVAIIFNKMLNIKTKSDTFQVLGMEEFSK